MHRILASLLLLSTVACAELEPFEPADDDTGTVGNAIFGPDGGVAPRPGVVQIAIPGDPQVRTGFLVSPTLVMMSRRWISSATVAANVRIRHGVLPGAAERPGWAITVNGFMPMAFIQVAQPFANVPTVPFATRSPAMLVGDTVTCVGYDDPREFQSSVEPITAIDGEREVLTAAASPLEDHDAGAPCFDRAGSLAGFVLETRATARARIFLLFDTRWFVDNMLRVARLRSSWGQPTLGYAIETTGQNFVQLCMEVFQGNPYSGVAATASPCHGGASQRWFLDYTNPFGPAFVNAQTGSCLDVPGHSTVPDTDLIAGRCNDGSNQAFASGWRSTLTAVSSPLDFRFSPARPTLCLIPEAGLVSPRRLEQERCTNQPLFQEQWTFRP